MREIKFRAWDTENKEMLKVENLYWDETTGEFLIRTTMYTDYFSTDDIVIMQYTGLKDKNGVEIYEGDVVNIEYRETTIERAVIEYKGTSFYGATNADDWELDMYYSIEVIGNIYDNPELIEKEGK